MDKSTATILWFKDLSRLDAAHVGGKGASLGEMYGALVPKGVRVPDGFVSTTASFQCFVNGQVPERFFESVEDDGQVPGMRMRVARTRTLADALHACFAEAAVKDQLEMHARTAYARALVVATPVSLRIDAALREGYAELCRMYGPQVDVAVRSSATCEDSALNSFAGQCESYLNIHGADSVVLHWKRCVASLFTERAVSYQIERGMDPLGAALAVVVMKMVRSDLASSGVLFTLDPESGHRGVIHISAAYGLGELVVQGSVSPDTFTVWKEGLRRGRPSIVHKSLGAKDRKMVYSAQGGASTESVDVLSALRRAWALKNEEVLDLGRMALLIEDHYGQPMDIEWAKDGRTGDLFIVQARPETVHARNVTNKLERYGMDDGLVRELTASGRRLVTGQAVGTRIGAGKVRVYQSYEEVILKKRALRNRITKGEDIELIPAEERVFDRGDVLVTSMTTPDWEPMMKEASLIVTERGGRTSHAAIIAREFGIPAIVGAEKATEVLTPLMEVTGSCAEGEIGSVYKGTHPWIVEEVDLGEPVQLRTKINLNVGFPDKALRDAMLPADGVGLARIEFILTAEVGIHPLALAYREELWHFHDTGEVLPELSHYAERLRAEPKAELRGMLGAIDRRTAGYADKREFFVDRIKMGVGLICAAFHPRPVLVRLSDLKSNEYRELLGGRLFEPCEENPMIAWRGASRYVDPRFLPAFELECEALRAVRRDLGLDNLQVMVPFCRTPEEGRDVRQLMDDRGLAPETGVPVYLMIELPSNVIEADAFIASMRLDGGSIGSNDLVQTVYAVSRDDLERYPYAVDARSSAVKTMIRAAVKAFRDAGLPIGICGQAPSDFPNEVPPFLVECGITSISVTPDTLMVVRQAVARAEAGLAQATSERPLTI
ncbi:MAG: phosphoenolpyruvate synthase [Planctomycetes bacterium]|nr:phosphoenolpyruvate synthase [Planctomycetota bacterium]